MLVAFLGLYLTSVPFVSAGYCPVTKEQKSEPDVVPCKNNPIQYFTQGYDLDREEMNNLNPGLGMDGWSDDEWQSNIILWVQGKGLDATCVWFKLQKVTVQECCYGYGGDDCEDPVCTVPCENGGECVAPNTCQCAANFEGPYCNQDKRLITETHKYCFDKSSCIGPLAMAGVVTFEQCCSNGGLGWGATKDPVTGKTSCLMCSENFHPDANIEANLDQPQVIPNDGSLPFRTCFMYGPFYYRTMDGLEFLFPGQCTYILFSDGPRVVMETKVDCFKFSTCKRKLTMQLNTQDSVTAIGGDIKVNGVAKDISQSYGWASVQTGVKIQKVGDCYYLSSGNLRVKWNDDNMVQVTIEGPLNPAGSSVFKGLCGNMDGDPWNDLKKPNNQATTSPAVFGNSWAWQDSTDLCPDAPTSEYACSTMQDELDAKKACSYLFSDQFKPCHSTVMVNHYFYRCVNDYCAVKNFYLRNAVQNAAAMAQDLKAVLCTAFGAYCHECSMNMIVLEWRTADLCPKECPAGLVYSECTPKCPRTCTSMYSILPSECYNECYPGCKCPEGTFLYDDRCVNATECPCHFMKKIYASGSSLKIDCNHCVCSAGRWECTAMACTKTCSVIGYSHFKTFDGAMYEYYGGDCLYTLTEIRPEEVGDKGYLKVAYKPYDCTGMGITCIKMISVYFQKGSHITDIKVNADYTAMINGISYADLALEPFSNEFMYVKKLTSLFVMIRGFGFKVLYSGNGRIYVTLDPYFMKKVQGLCGDNDGDISNDATSSTGILSSIMEFGDSWSEPSCSFIANTDPATTNPCQQILRPMQMHRTCAAGLAMKQSSVSAIKSWTGCGIRTNVPGTCVPVPTRATITSYVCGYLLYLEHVNKLVLMSTGMQTRHYLVSAQLLVSVVMLAPLVKCTKGVVRYAMPVGTVKSVVSSVMMNAKLAVPARTLSF
jgi:hypothetical protein